MGFHVQLYHYPEDETDAFECGAVSVEFFFVLSGFFLPRSLEKINSVQI